MLQRTRPAQLVSAVLALMAAGGAIADPGRITKYVLPDGRVVYSDKPVPGATAAEEILTEPASPPTAAPITRGTAAADVTSSTLDSAGLPANMTPSQAAGRMLGAAVDFATFRTAAWEHNTRLYLLWRVGGAEISRDCFLGTQGACLFTDMTDKDLVLTLFRKCRDMESADDMLKQAVKQDASAMPYVIYFAQAVLARNITATYKHAEEVLDKERANPSQPGPTPRLVVAFTAAEGRRLLQLEHQDLRGWTFNDVLGWHVVYRPAGVPLAENAAVWFADTEIPFRETPAP
jgi:hypothetical protein